MRLAMFMSRLLMRTFEVVDYFRRRLLLILQVFSSWYLSIFINYFFYQVNTDIKHFLWRILITLEQVLLNDYWLLLWGCLFRKENVLSWWSDCYWWFLVSCLVAWVLVKMLMKRFLSNLLISIALEPLMTFRLWLGTDLLDLWRWGSFLFQP